MGLPETQRKTLLDKKLFLNECVWLVFQEIRFLQSVQHYTLLNCVKM